MIGRKIECFRCGPTISYFKHNLIHDEEKITLCDECYAQFIKFIGGFAVKSIYPSKKKS